MVALETFESTAGLAAANLERINESTKIGYTVRPLTMSSDVVSLGTLASVNVDLHRGIAVRSPLATPSDVECRP